MKSILDVSLKTNQPGAMQKLIFILLIASLMGACKKESSGPKDIFISKILSDGEAVEEYVYNSDGLLIEVRYFKDNVVSGRYEYHYDNNGNLLERLNYTMPANQLGGRHIYTLNSAGQIERQSIWDMTGGGPGTLNFHIDHTYKDGLCTMQTWKNKEEKIDTYRAMAYYPNGNMRTSEVYYLYSGAPEKQWGSSYSPSDTVLPVSLTHNKAYPVNFYLPYLTSSSITHFTYDDGDVETQTQEIMSGRKFNSRGLTTEVTITTKKIKPAGPDEVRTVRFEYKEL